MTAETMRPVVIQDGMPVVPWVARWIAADDLQVDGAYQRREQSAIVHRLATNFNLDLAGALRVSQRPDGSYWVKDGQHRLKAAIAHGLTHVYCYVEQGQRDDEARSFPTLNSGTHAESLRRFKAALEAKDDPSILDVAALITATGFEIDYDRTIHGPSAFWAVQTAVNLYTSKSVDGVSGKDRLRRVLTLARATWPDKDGAGQSVILKALDRLFFNERLAMFSQQRFVRKVGVLHPAVVAATAHERTRAHGYGPDTWALKDIVDEYNKGLRDPLRSLQSPLRIRDLPVPASDIDDGDDKGTEEVEV